MTFRLQFRNPSLTKSNFESAKDELMLITVKDLISYHNDVYIEECKSRGLGKIDPNSPFTALKYLLQPASPNKSKPIVVDELIVDAEIYDRHSGNIDSTMNNQNVLDFVHSQKLHKQNFLEEIKQKGLTRKVDSNKLRDEKPRPPMNY